MEGSQKRVVSRRVIRILAGPSCAWQSLSQSQKVEDILDAKEPQHMQAIKKFKINDTKPN